MPKSQQIIDLAVIIPTLNEEGFIGRLLDSIAKQTVLPKEIVVIDAYSKDKTIAEIKKRQKNLIQLKFFRIPRYTVARQRNFGVKKTNSENILFLDADMELRDKQALEKYFGEIILKKPDIAVAKNLPDSNHWKDAVYFKAEDLFFKLSKYFWPVIVARNVYVRRKMFTSVGGFNESVTVAEDQELAHRILKKGGKLVFLKTLHLHTSVRRIATEGRIRYTLKMLLFGLDIILRGRQKSHVKYDFGHFKKD